MARRESLNTARRRSRTGRGRAVSPADPQGPAQREALEALTGRCTRAGYRLAGIKAAPLMLGNLLMPGFTDQSNTSDHRIALSVSLAIDWIFEHLDRFRSEEHTSELQS